MAALLWLFLLSAFHAVALAQQRYSNITLGSSLSPTTNSSWFSPTRRFAFGFYEQTDGYAVGISIAGMRKKIVVWTANRNSPVVPSSTVLLLTSDGRLIVQVGGKEISVINPSQAIASASMLDTGNFVLYNSDHNIIWQSFDNPTNTLLPGQHLSAPQEMFSSASEADDSFGIFRLKMQNDGNLVQYPIHTPDDVPYGYFSTKTNTAGNNVTLNLDDDAHLYLFKSNISLKNLTNGGYPRERTIIYVMKIDVDGILRVYSHSLNQQKSSAIWSSTNDLCFPKGRCGLNSFCINMDDKVECACLPGFDFVIQGNWSVGCERNFTAETCQLKENTSKYYDMSTVDNTKWVDFSYAVLVTTTKEACEQACLQDCNCGAALFNAAECRKQMLPLRYGRRDMSNANQALVKVGISVVAKKGLPNQNEETNNNNNIPIITKGKKLRIDILIASIILAIFALLVLGISGFVIHRNHWTYRKIQESRSVQLCENVAPRAFSYAELEQATSGFKEELGRGAFGTVFKGILQEDQKVVAVKRLDKELVEGETEFQIEMKIIGRTHHRNLVRLLGYCLDGSRRLLVYEYMSNGSLADVLFTPEKQPTWEKRCGIARDIARGLLYLHEECDTQIIHCNIKPQNILMDDHFCAKISDFGMAKLLKKDQTRTYTGVRGTRGYVAPEWHRKLPVTVKADVYSFGVVLLELICRRKCVDWSLEEDESILEYWVYGCFEAGELGKLVGNEEVDRRQFERMVKISIWCIQEESLRPSMKKVLLMLEGTVEIPVPPSATSFQSSI
ncbi:G-type lectin S-receptor-like serine/threonine-protein kinase LECRK3 [Lycium barbarum]|uniref:G-type lectin S-receptor-like serine/threonine-protein kinase LECRK3 n=1 Tax=Lycium barbarum TaxID=112863 RepID=UPI00293F6B91|nr:G-type lectin S-receptor-like serine/threonine-protein kinase LECRK3 [Lycium barbarum]XP_060184715.1 G-type lectin S-receptor-like serine/threonine-protein kinase LECRK3 [Lycium barbarum]XP_060184716.1 G-type lectin S-receptor-like serine/threonine-protein kinase LECRK3 [Lycium barbarum]